MEEVEVSIEASNVVAKLSQVIGTSEPALRLLLSLLTGYPLALLHRKFLYGKAPTVQHLYFAVTGLALGYFNYGCDVLHSCTAMLLTYAVLLFMGGTSMAVSIVFVFNMLYLLLGYYYVGTESYDINWTMPQCVLVLRLIGLAFDLYDGAQKVETLSAENKKVALAEMPSILETCGFVFFPGSYLVGPQFPLKRYQDFVAGKFSDDDVKVPPDSTKAAINKFGLGLMYLAIYQLLLSKIVSDNYILSDQFEQQNFFKKCVLLGLWGRYTLYKYISCWLITEGACILFGITYNGKDEKGVKQWNGFENVQILVFENATEFNHYIQSFNTNTNHWIAQYIYKRLKFLGNRLVSQGLSLLFLAVWHGFHSGYYICFAFEFIVMYLEKDLKPLIKGNDDIYKFFFTPPMNTFVYILLRCYTFVFMGWCLLPFALMTYDRYFVVYRSLYYIGFWIFGLYPFLYGPILRLFLKKKRPHVE